MCWIRPADGVYQLQAHKPGERFGDAPGARIPGGEGGGCGYVSGDGAHRMCGGNTKETYLEILYFKQFYKHFVFSEDEEGNRNKRMERYFEVSAVVDVGCGDTKNSYF